MTLYDLYKIKSTSNLPWGWSFCFLLIVFLLFFAFLSLTFSFSLTISSCLLNFFSISFILFQSRLIFFFFNFSNIVYDQLIDPTTLIGKSLAVLKLDALTCIHHVWIKAIFIKLLCTIMFVLLFKVIKSYTWVRYSTFSKHKCLIILYVIYIDSRWIREK